MSRLSIAKKAKLTWGAWGTALLHSASSEAWRAGSKKLNAIRCLCLALTLGGCIASDAAPTGVAPDSAAPDSVAPDVTPQCTIDRDCTPPDTCTIAACVDRVCVFSAKTCDDGNDCTSDSCGADGCVSTNALPGTLCHEGPSEACVGDVYHFQDVCVDGVCRDNGTQDCAAEVGGPCFSWACAVTENGAGCEVAPRDEGLSCNSDGLSEQCVDGSLHGADVCRAGECVDGGAIRCPTDFCEAPQCTNGTCDARPVGVQRALTGNWLMVELTSFEGQRARLGTLWSGFAFRGDGHVTTYGTLTSAPLLAAPGDGDYCLDSDGTLRFALPYGAVSPAPYRLYRGVVTPSDDIAVVFRESEQSLGLMMQLPTTAPTLDGDYRVVGLMRRNVVGVRAVQGDITFANGCIAGGAVRFSDELDTIAITPGECQGTIGYLIGVHVDFGGEAYFLRGTANHDGDVAMLTLHTNETSVGDALIILMRGRPLGGIKLDGRHTFARLDVDQDVVSSARGDATLFVDGTYGSYREVGLDGSELLGVGGLQLSDTYVGGIREQSGERLGVDRVRLGAGGAIALSRVGMLADIRVPGDTDDEAAAAPLGTSLRITIVRP